MLYQVKFNFTPNFLPASSTLFSIVLCIIKYTLCSPCNHWPFCKYKSMCPLKDCLLHFYFATISTTDLHTVCHTVCGTAASLALYSAINTTVITHVQLCNTLTFVTHSTHIPPQVLKISSYLTTKTV